MKKHTAGPWVFDSPDIKGWIMKGDVYLLEMVDEDDEGRFINDYDEREANGRLAAAAPDLLAALEFVEKRLTRSGYPDGPNLQTIRDAIRKATEGA